MGQCYEGDGCIEAIEKARQERCPHPSDALIAYTEDGIRYHACTACKEIWELPAEEANEARQS